MQEDVEVVTFARENLDYRYRTGKITITTRDNGLCAMHGFEKFLKQKLGRETLEILPSMLYKKGVLHKYNSD